MKIGIIGTGGIGQALAGHIAKAGFETIEIESINTQFNFTRTFARPLPGGANAAGMLTEPTRYFECGTGGARLMA